MDIKDLLSKLTSSGMDISSFLGSDNKNVDIMKLLPLIMSMQNKDKKSPKIIDNEINSTIKKLFD